MILALLVVLVAACSPQPTPEVSPSASSQPASSPAIVQDAIGGMAFERPSRWAPWQPNLHAPITDGPLLYLTTDALLPTCAVAMSATPNPPDAAGQACPWPLTSLSTDGVVIQWYNNRILSSLPRSGEPIEVNGATARIQIDRPGACSAIGADETMSVLLPTETSATLSNLSVLACLRGPALPTSEAEVRAMLASITGTP